MNKYKKFIYGSLIFFITIPIVLISFNYIIDPNYRYRLSVPLETLTELFNSNSKVLELPPNYDDRAILKKVVKAAHPPSIVLLGGSRIMNVSAEVFDSRFQNYFLNLGVTAGTINDYIAVWQLLKEHNLVPKYILIAVEEQSLNNESQNNRYLSILDYYKKFFDSEPSIRHYLIGIMTNLKDLLSLETTLESFKKIINMQDNSSKFILKDVVSVSGKTQSFSSVYSEEFETKSLDKLKLLGIQNGIGEIKALSHWNVVEEFGILKLNALLADIKKHNSIPVLIGMPYHPEAYRIISDNPKAHSTLMKMIELLKKIAAVQEIYFYDGIETYHADFLETDFKDGVHLTYEANSRFFLKIFRNIFG